MVERKETTYLRVDLFATPLPLSRKCINFSNVFLLAKSGISSLPSRPSHFPPSDLHPKLLPRKTQVRDNTPETGCISDVPKNKKDESF